jgi:medium-chain acyl-[acyl-carrier-protein] hydrolase
MADSGAARAGNARGNPWVESRASGAERIRLFCFPFAGGNGQIYRSWQADLPPEIGVFAVELPGRGTRFREPAIDDMTKLIAVLQEMLAPLLDRPFALFGHSMGAGIAYEAARHLAGPGGRPASHLFVSARRAPGLPSRRRRIDSLDDAELLEELRDLGGTPEEVLREPELMALLLPMLRADFRLNDGYTPLPEPRLACPLTVFGGRSDPEAFEHELEWWRTLAGGAFDLRLFPGGHYYFRDVQRELLGEIARRLAPAVIAS